MIAGGAGGLIARRARVLARGSSNLFGLPAASGEAARSAQQTDAGVTAAVRARAKAR